MFSVFSADIIETRMLSMMDDYIMMRKIVAKEKFYDEKVYVKISNCLFVKYIFCVSEHSAFYHLARKKIISKDPPKYDPHPGPGPNSVLGDFFSFNYFTFITIKLEYSKINNFSMHKIKNENNTSVGFP